MGRKRKDSIAIPILLLMAFLAVVCLIGHGCPPDARGEPVRVSGFSGIVTHVDPAMLGWDQARKSVGWVYRSGMLMRETFDQQTTTVHDGTALHFLGQSRSDSSVLFYGQDLYRLYGGAETGITLASASSNYDSVIAWAGDSAIQSWEFINDDDTGAVQKWLNWTLTDRHTIRLDGTVTNLRHWYSNTWARLADTANDPTGSGGSTADTLGTLVAFHIDATGGTGTIEYRNEAGDTTLLLDGAYLWHYTGGSVTDNITEAFVSPTYLDTGRVDSVTEHGDTVNFWGDFGADVDGDWILWDDTTLADDHRAYPCSVYAHYDDGDPEERISVAADSSLHEGVNHFDDGMYFVTYQPGTPAPDPTQEGIDGTGVITDSIRNVGWHDSLFYQRIFLKIPLVPQTYSVQYDEWTNLLNRRNRVTDCNVWSAYRYVNGTDTVQVHSVLGSDTLNTAADTLFCDFLAFDVDTFDVSGGGTDGTVVIRFMKRPLLEWSSSMTGPTAMKFKFGITHRRRAWYAGHSDSLMTVGWSEANSYAAIAANIETLEGNDPITGLSSYGQQMVAWRRRSGEYITGFAETDFYKAPIPAGVGAVNHTTIARSGRDNADYFCNDLGLWSYQGGGVQPVGVQVQEIFTDSIDWDEEEHMRAAVWNDRYWLAYPHSGDTANTRLAVFDLESGDVGYIGAFNVASMWVYKGSDGSEKLYLGCADSTVIWLAGGTDDVYELADWRSGWWDGGDRGMRKRVLGYTLDYNATSGDSVFVDWYTNGDDTAVWSDTVVAVASGFTVHGAVVPRTVQGRSLSFGFRSPDVTLSVLKIEPDVVTLGRERLR